MKLNITYKNAIKVVLLALSILAVVGGVQLYRSSDTKTSYAYCNDLESLARTTEPSLFANANILGAEYHCRDVIGEAGRLTSITYTMQQRDKIPSQLSAIEKKSDSNSVTSPMYLDNVKILSYRHGVYTFTVRLDSSRKPDKPNTKSVNNDVFTIQERQQYPPFDPLKTSVVPEGFKQWSYDGFGANDATFVAHLISTNPKQSQTTVTMIQELDQNTNSVTKGCSEPKVICKQIGTNRYNKPIFLQSNGPLRVVVSDMNGVYLQLFTNAGGEPSISQQQALDIVSGL
jgi:hypothetical protein